MLSKQFSLPKALFLPGLLLISKTVWSAEALHIGHITSLQNDVITRTAEPADEKKLQLNDKIFFKQQIITKENANAIITFRDGSTFTVAPQSVVVMDEFIFNPAENVSEKSIKVLKGTFRYISGVAIKNAKTEIKTPFGTAGIRGSADDGNVHHGDAAFTLMVGNGQATVTSNNGQRHMPLTTGTSAQSYEKEVKRSSNEENARSAQYFSDSFSFTDTSQTRGLTQQQVIEDASANNTPTDTQRQAAGTAKEAPVNTQHIQSNETSDPQWGPEQGDPHAIVTRYTQSLQNQNNQQSTSVTLKVVEAVIRANPSAAASIVKATVAAKPSLATAITTAAINAAPTQATAITSASTTAVKNDPTTPANTASEVVSSAVTTVVENPSTVNNSDQAATIIQNAVKQGVITPEQAEDIKSRLNVNKINNIINPNQNPASPN